MARTGRPKSDNQCLNDIAYGSQWAGGGDASFSIPSYDYVALTYYTTTNNIHTQVFKSGGASGTTVATLTYAYVGGGASNDDNISSITQS